MKTEHIPSYGFRVWEGRVRPGDAMEAAHTHEDIEMNFVISGSLRYLMSDGIVELKAGDFALFWAGIPHQLLEADNPTDVVYITVPLERYLVWQVKGPLTERMLGGDVLFDSPETKEERILEEYRARAWALECSKEDHDLTHIVALEIMARIRRLGLLLRHHDRRNRLPAGSRPLQQFIRITQYLKEHYTEDIITEDVAREVGLNPKYLMQFFKKMSHMTLWEYVLYLRMAHARRLMLSTERKITDIAEDAGFQSLSSFYTTFQKMHPGSKPNAWRKRTRA